MLKAFSDANVPHHAIGVDRNVKKFVAHLNVDLISGQKHAVDVPAVELQALGVVF